MGLTALTGAKGNTAMLLDMAGSIWWRLCWYGCRRPAMRGKDMLSGGSGQTPYEKISEVEQKRFAETLRNQILTEYGLVPGTREQYAMDPTTGMGVS